MKYAGPVKNEVLPTLLHATAINMKNFPEGALNVSPDEIEYEVVSCADKTATVLSGAIADVFPPMSKYLTTALAGMGAGVGSGVEVDLKAHE